MHKIYTFEQATSHPEKFLKQTISELELTTCKPEQYIAIIPENPNPALKINYAPISKLLDEI